MKVKRNQLGWRVVPTRGHSRGQHRPIHASGQPLNGIEQEHICWDPKDGELYLNRMNPEETLVEVRRDTDVQIVR